MKIAIFGGSKPKPEDPAYQQAYTLGKILGNYRSTVITGGYMGIMEAVSRGAVEAGGKTIGVTCEEIETWRKSSANQWVQKEVYCGTLIERISTLISLSQAIIVLPGGVGTLTELLVVWNHLLIKAISPRPFILVGSAWENTLTSFFNQLNAYISEQQFKLITFVPDIHEAIKILDIWFRESYPEVI